MTRLTYYNGARYRQLYDRRWTWVFQGTSGTVHRPVLWGRR